MGFFRSFDYMNVYTRKATRSNPFLTSYGSDKERTSSKHFSPQLNPFSVIHYFIILLYAALVSIRNYKQNIQHFYRPQPFEQ